MKKNSRHIQDVRRGASSLVRLKPLSFKEKVVRLARNPRVRAGSIISLVIAVVLVGYSFVARANIEHLYTHSCLGDWIGVENAQGEPDAGSNPEDFTDKNSAILSTTTGRIYCGNFTGNIPDGAQISNVKVHIDFALKDKLPVGLNPDAINSEGTIDPNLASSTASTSDFITPAEVKDLIEQSSTSSTNSPLIEDTTTTPPSAESATSSVPSSDTQPTDTQSTDTQSTDTQATSLLWNIAYAQEVDATPTEVVAPAAAPVDTTTTDTASSETITTAPADTTITDTTPTDTTSSGTTTVTPADATQTVDSTSGAADALTGDATETTTTTDSPTIDTPVIPDDTSSAEATTSTTSDDATLTSDATPTPEVLGVATSTSSTTVVEGSVPSDGGLTKAYATILYTTDGITWNRLGDIDSSSENPIEMVIPVSLNDLPKLQISIQSTGSQSNPPEIYVDDISLSVEYTPNEQPFKTQDDAPPPSVLTWQSSAYPDNLPVDLTPTDSPSDNCSFEPFSQTVQAGSSVDFALHLSADRSQPIKIDLTSPPAHVQALIGPSNSIFDGNEMAVKFNTDANAPRGSYSLPLSFSHYENGSLTGSICQLNLVIE